MNTECDSPRTSENYWWTNGSETTDLCTLINSIPDTSVGALEDMSTGVCPNVKFSPLITYEITRQCEKDCRGFDKTTHSYACSVAYLLDLIIVAAIATENLPAILLAKKKLCAIFNYIEPTEQESPGSQGDVPHNYINPLPAYLLRFACQFGNLQIIEQFARVGKWKGTLDMALSYCCKNGLSVILDLILRKNKADIVNTHNDFECINGTEYHINTYAQIVYQNDDVSCMRVLLKYMSAGNAQSVLSSAVSHGSPECVELILTEIHPDKEFVQLLLDSACKNVKYAPSKAQSCIENSKKCIAVIYSHAHTRWPTEACGTFIEMLKNNSQGEYYTILASSIAVVFDYLTPDEQHKIAECICEYASPDCVYSLFNKLFNLMEFAGNEINYPALITFASTNPSIRARSSIHEEETALAYLKQRYGDDLAKSWLRRIRCTCSRATSLIEMHEECVEYMRNFPCADIIRFDRFIKLAIEYSRDR